MRTGRSIAQRSWLGWILVIPGLVVAMVVGEWLYMRFAAQTVHANPQAIPSVTQTSPSPRWSEAVEQTRRILRDGMIHQNLPGLSVAVGAGGDVVWAEGFGWSDLEARTPVTPDTRFRIGTASMALTSAAAGLLVDRGRMKLDDDIQTYVPEFPKKQWSLTPRQLMGDVGGVGTDGEDGPLFRQRCDRPVEGVRQFANDPLLFEPGTQRQDSDYGWILMSAAVEAAAQQPFLAFMRDQIFEPLRMEDTGAESATEENPDRIGEPAEDPPFMTFAWQVILKPLGIGGAKTKPATAPATIYNPGFGNNPQVRYGLHVMRARNLSCYAGSLAFLSTPTDLTRFGLAIEGGKLLKPATGRLLQTSQQLRSGQETGHGLGWEVGAVTLSGESRQTASREGKLLGKRVVSLIIFRDSGIVVAVMANRSDADTRALAIKVAEEFARTGRG